MGDPPAWGGPPVAYGYGPPPPRKSNGGVIAALAGGGVLVVILLVVGVVALSGSGDDPRKTSGQAAYKAGQTLGRMPGLTLTGTYGDGEATFSVTKGGSARGTYTADGSQVGRVDVGGATYLKAGSAFWTAQGVSSTRADKADGKWTKAPDYAVGLNLTDLSPARLGQVLRQAGNDPQAVKTPIGGVQTIRMHAGGRTYYISAAQPRHLVHIESSSGENHFAFDVKSVTATEMGPVFTALRGDVQGLKDAYDPGVVVMPEGKLRFGSCGSPGCTVHADVRPASSDNASQGRIRISMKVKFSGSGGTVSTCTDSASAKPGQKTALSCRTGGGKWSSWYNSQNGRFTIHASASFESTVNSAGDVKGLLDRLSQEQQGG